MDYLRERGEEYITGRYVDRERDAVMFDIDDTLIFISGLPNTPMISLLQQAKVLGYKIVIITARPNISPVIHSTVEQLKYHNIEFDHIGFVPAEEKGLLKRNSGLNYILSVGDMETDLTDSKHILNTSNFYHS